jgi:hypothetical protein
MQSLSRCSTAKPAAPVGRVFNSITEAIGDTPIVRLRRLPD